MIPKLKSASLIMVLMMFYFSSCDARTYPQHIYANLPTSDAQQTFCNESAGGCPATTTILFPYDPRNVDMGPHTAKQGDYIDFYITCIHGAVPKARDVVINASNLEYKGEEEVRATASTPAFLKMSYKNNQPYNRSAQFYKVTCKG